MLSYQHGYHAGSFADVVKHLTLTRIIQYLTQKDKPTLYLETHSGRGLYDLKQRQANKTAEFRDGISLFWEDRKKAPETCAPYLDVIKSINKPNELRFYPGSPYLAQSGFKRQDRLVFSELHHEEFSHLEQMPKQGKRIFFKEADGIKEMHALLPPVERRGLIFIDPSYEIKDEYKTIPRAVKLAYSKFATGVYCIWYPIIDERFHRQIVSGLKSIEGATALRLEFNLTPPAQMGMTGCGLWIINPPYVLAEEMKHIFEFLKNIFNKGVSSYLIEAY